MLLYMYRKEKAREESAMKKEETNNMNKKSDTTNKIVMTGLMMCLVTIATMFIKIPVPMTQGYVHLGDSMIFLSVLVLGKKRGTAAAGIGSALGDLFAGYAFWIPWTLAIKGIMAFIMGAIIEKFSKEGDIESKGRVTLVEVLAMIAAGGEMVVGYYIAAGFMYGNWVSPIASMPWNIGQFVVGMIIAVLISTALYKTPARKYFAIK